MARRYSIPKAKLRVMISEAEPGVDQIRGREQHFKEAYQQFVAKHALKRFGVDPEFASSVRDLTPGRRRGGAAISNRRAGCRFATNPPNNGR